MKTIRDTVRAAVFGHAIADAMGVPVEFTDRSALAKNPVKGYVMHWRIRYEKGNLH